MKISAVIITKNEEKNIGRCLESLKGVADEILVLDSFSTDRTRDICAEYGVNFMEVEWMGYSKTKNFGNDSATGDYILSLDADEALSDTLRKSILNVKDQLSGGYEFNRLNHYAGKPVKCCGWYPDKKLRLFPKGMAEWKGDFVHEELMPKPDLKIEFLPGDLLHFTYASKADHEARAEKYANLAAEKLAQSGKRGLAIKAIFSPIFRFFKMYVLKGGMFAGKEGYWIAAITSREVRMKYRRAISLRKSRK